MTNHNVIQGGDTMAKPQLRAVDQQADEEANEMADALQASLEEIQSPSPKPIPKMRIKSAREWSERMLAELTAAEQELQTKLAAADAAYDNTVSQASAERERIKADVGAELKQVTALRSATTIFKGELVKAEV